MASGYARELLKIVIAQICQSMDCEGIEQSACETMVDILQHYIEELGFLSHSYAEHAGRIEANFNDTMLALKDLQVPVKDLMLFHSQVEEMPFARAIPRFPMGPTQKRRKILTSSDAFPPHIPHYFPPFPDKSTFVQTPLYIERERDRKKLRIRKNKERGQLEQNLTELHAKIDKTNLTNYDTPAGAISSDLVKVKTSSKVDRNVTPPTPIDPTSRFLNSLYVTRPVTEPPPPPEPTEPIAQKEKDKLHHVEAILALTHEKNIIDPLVLDPQPTTTTTSQSTTTTAPTTTTTTTLSMATNTTTPMMPTLSQSYHMPTGQHIMINPLGSYYALQGHPMSMMSSDPMYRTDSVGGTGFYDVSQLPHNNNN